MCASENMLYHFFVNLDLNLVLKGMGGMGGMLQITHDYELVDDVSCSL
jgi:hypothetical protein